MSVITDTKTVMQILAGKSLNNAQMLSIATKFAKHHNLQNPWDETDAEYAAWPTVNDLATFFLAKSKNWIVSGIGEVAGREYDKGRDNARNAAVIAAQDEM